MLGRKLLRDIRKNLSQFITIFLMVGIGVMVYAGIEAYMLGMQTAGDNYYANNNLQDLNVMGANFTEEDLQKIEEIEHVERAERKLTLTATSGEKTLNVNFIESNEIAKFWVREGVEFDAENEGIWLDYDYALANELNVGDRMTLAGEGREFEGEIVALIGAPDHIYELKDDSQLVPDHAAYGFAYMSAKTLGEAKIFNYVLVDVDEKDNVKAAKAAIEDEVEAAYLVSRIEDSVGFQTYQGEIDEGKSFVGIFSGLFIAIALLSVVTTMSRVVNKQKLQIGTLKALGFSNSKVAWHYVSFGFYVSLLGAIAGLIVGYYGIGGLFMNMQMEFFPIPEGYARMAWQSYLVAAGVVLAVSLAAYFTARKQLTKNAAEALRNAVPDVKTRGLNVTTMGIFKRFGFSTKWNIRDILRNKLRTITAVFGAASCAMLLVCGFGMVDTMNGFIDEQFNEFYNFENKLSLAEGASEADREALEEKYGSATSQTLLIDTRVDGEVESNNALIVDAEEKLRFGHESGSGPVEIENKDGVYITRKLAAQLGLAAGDEIEWREFGGEWRKSEIVGLNRDAQNQNMTMTRAYYESLGREYRYDTLYTNEAIAEGEEIAGVATVANPTELASSMESVMSRMMSMVYLIAFIAVLLGAVIIYNTSILSFAEKQYQFATLKVLGFSDGQIARVFVQQNLIITLLSVIIGLPAGYFLLDWLFKSMLDVQYDIPVVILLATYLIAGIGTFVAGVAVSAWTARKVRQIDMVSSLKADE